MKDISLFPEKKIEELTNTFDDDLKVRFPTFGRADLRRLKREHKEVAMKRQGVKEIVAKEGEATKLLREKADLEKKYREALRQVDALAKERDALISFKRPIETYEIMPRGPVGGSESAVVTQFSDVHFEENVRAETVNGLNRYNIDIARKRSETYFALVPRLVEIEGAHTQIKNLVLHLGGDFISGSIHEDVAESSELRPAHAILAAQEVIASGITFLLKHTKLDIVVVCDPGNHSRTTDTLRIANEMGYSWEYVMYHELAQFFAGESRVKFQIAEGYHNYVTVFGKVIRFHHGNGIRYQGGVGGITIPLNKAIAQWNKAKRADIDCLCHWHTWQVGSNFAINGSVIGYNPYALSIKAEYERPQQMFFLVHQKFGMICFRKIVLD